MKNYRIGYCKRRDGRQRWSYLDVTCETMEEAVNIIVAMARNESTFALNCRELREGEKLLEQTDNAED